MDGALTDTVDGFGADIEFQYNQVSVLSLTGHVSTQWPKLTLETKYGSPVQRTLGLTAGVNHEVNLIKAAISTGVHRSGLVIEEGQADVSIALSEDGDNLIIEANWPQAIVNFTRYNLLSVLLTADQ